MTSILIVKTSSLGDVVHSLPVIADIRAALGDVTIDWVAERSFAAIPAMHPGIRQVLACEIRRWRKTWMQRETRREWDAFKRRLRSQAYDAIVDTQGLLKSAVIARIARGRRFGLDWHSSREPLAPLYDAVFRVPWTCHAVERNRMLCGQALGYPVVGAPVYGIAAGPVTADWLPQRPYVVLLHATSHPSKLWPERNWIELGARLAAAGYAALIPWGTDDEHARARRIAGELPDAVVPQRLGLDVLAGAIGAASAAIGVDTGLVHLAAALGVPVVGVYGATDPTATGVYAPRAVNVGARGRFPAVDEVVAALDELRLPPARFIGAGA